MSLRLIVGRAGTNKSEHILEEIRSELKRDPFGVPIFYIVPEQMTFQQEYALFDDEIKGSIRAQVVSFSRLAWRVLQETGGATKQFISSTGTQMMLRKIVNEHFDAFSMFKKAVDKQGFIQELEGMITEFKRHNITPEMLQEQMTYTAENVPLQQKLHDLHVIYAHLTETLRSQYIDGEDQLQMLVDKIKDTSFLQRAIIYIDGFYRFTPKELAIIEQLLLTTERVTVALTADPNMVDEPYDELDLFYQTTETYNTLQQTAKEQRVHIEDPVFLHDEVSTLRHNEPLFHLEKYFDTRPAPAYETNEALPISIKEAIHPRAEVDGVVQEILRLVREEGYRYRDIVLFVRDTEQYYDLIATLFADYHIPVYIDEKKTMLNHPFIELIRSLFDVIDSNWRYDTVFRLLKTGLIEPTDEEYPLDEEAIDTLENYVLEYGIRNKQQWVQDARWKYERFSGFTDAVQTDWERKFEEKVNRYRMQVVKALEEIDYSLRRKKTVHERAAALYELFERFRIAEQLEKREVSFEDKGLLEKAREQHQAWDAVIHLLDELVELIGHEKVDFHQFRDIVEAGLESLQFSHVPPSIDHVIVGTIDHSRILHKKCAFLLGVNEGSWPQKPAIDGMINETERELLKQFGMELAASSRRVLLDENFYMYTAFTLATDYVMVSYVLSDYEGKAKTISPMITRLQQFFPSIQTPTLLTDPENIYDAERFITTPEKTRAALTAQLSRYLRGYPMETIWLDVFDWYVANEKKYDTTYNVLQSLFYENKPEPLAEETVKELHPTQLYTSVSRLENFYQCSYQHFLQYGLRLEERRTYALEAPDIGQLFHEALKTITEWVQEEKKDFKHVTKEDANRYAEKSVATLAPILQHQILQSSNRFKYIQQKLQQVIAQATYILSEQARASGFSPVGVELGFGYQSELDPLRIALPNGYELFLRGRIDRVDRAYKDEQLYLRIIDYKSSARGLQLVDVYYGLALQMLTYLDVVLSQAESWLGEKAFPAGILYFHVHDAMLSVDDKLPEDKIVAELFKQYKMAGYMMEDEQVATLMDDTVTSGRSNIAPFGLKKDGGFYSDSKVIDEATFQLLRNYIHYLIKEAGIDITSGKIELNPYEDKHGTACRFCPYKAVCQFDPILRENNYRRLQPLNETEALEKMEQIKSD